MPEHMFCLQNCPDSVSGIVSSKDLNSLERKILRTRTNQSKLSWLRGKIVFDMVQGRFLSNPVQLS